MNVLWIRRIVVTLGLISGLALAGSVHADGSGADALTFEQRVRAQAAIEAVYTAHRIGAPRDAVSRQSLERKVRRYAAQSRALETFWQRPVTEAMLARELQRIAAESRMPRRLQELFDALGNDPILIQECLVRARLVDRLVTEFAATDKRLRPTEGDPWPLDALLARQSRSAAMPATVATRLTLPRPGATAGAVAETCPAEAWDPLVAMEPEERSGATAVWTGAEMIVWGGLPNYRAYGERYDPATNSWTRTSAVHAPTGRWLHTAVWTGTEMIVWGGRTDSELFIEPSGGRYDPQTDTWSSLATANAPAGRAEHVAVWTGTEMIVWGGRTETVEGSTSGGRYDPVADQWTPMGTAGAPDATTEAAAVWTGDTFVVWGGRPVDAAAPIGAGGRYDPIADQWTPTAQLNAPTGRYRHTAVWSGATMVVWGGEVLETRDPTNDGARYDPVADVWTATSPTDAPAPRFAHTAVWTGVEMLVWGGAEERIGSSPVGIGDGARYDPVADTWSPLSTTNAPTPRYRHSAVWTDAEMVVFGGVSDRIPLDSGGRYDPVTDSWVPTSATATGAPRSQSLATSEEAVWTGSELVVLASTGDSGRYDPATASWNSVSPVGALEDFDFQNLAWSGSEVLVFQRDAGARYDPVQDSWRSMSLVDAPAVAGATASTIWTGSEMIVWGGDLFEDPGTGGRYDPVLDVWTPTTTVGAPPSRRYHTAVWTGTEMIVWGGRTVAVPDTLAPGARYDPVLDQWTPTSEVDAPIGREAHTAVWTGTEMIVWDGGTPPDDVPEGPPSGGRYDPTTDSWSSISLVGAPDRRWFHTAVWTGHRMLVWGGGEWNWPNGYGPEKATGGLYDPVADRWEPTTMNAVPGPRQWHVAFWTGDEMLVWGGRGQESLYFSTGGRYAFLSDNDEDGFCGSDDCDDDDATVHAGAPELNDALDNQCPGDAGYGAVDELAPTAWFDGDRFGWEAQIGATSYEVARSASREFVGDCTSWVTMDTFVDDAEEPAAGEVWHYLARAVAVNPGSWGLRSDGVERVVGCGGP